MVVMRITQLHFLRVRIAWLSQAEGEVVCRTHLPRTCTNGLFRCSKRRGLEKVSSMLYLQMEPLFVPVSLWGGLTPEVIAVP